MSAPAAAGRACSVAWFRGPPTQREPCWLPVLDQGVFILFLDSHPTHPVPKLFNKKLEADAKKWKPVHLLLYPCSRARCSWARLCRKVAFRIRSQRWQSAACLALPTSSSRSAVGLRHWTVMCPRCGPTVPRHRAALLRLPLLLRVGGPGVMVSGA